jgi:parallel beta-helix repeat protein
MLSPTKKMRSQGSRNLKYGVYSSSRLVLIIFLLCAIAFSVYQIKPVKSQIVTVGTAGPPQYDYSRIQDAVNMVLSGDTIEVASGIYYEHVYVNKSLTIVGENPQTTIVDGTANGTVFELDARNIMITGFTIRNAGNNVPAISITRDLAGEDFNIISNNKITSSLHGIYLSLSHQNTITGNSITTSNQYGIYMAGSHQNTITNNTLENNQFGGIYASGSNNESITGNIIKESAYGIRAVASINNIIAGNTISQTSYAIHLTSASTGNTIRNNILSGENSGIYTSSDSTTADHNTVTDGAYGMYFANCRYGSIYYNNISSSTGIRLYWSSPTTSNHNVNNNKVVDSDWAIEITNAYGNTLTGNWLQQNTYGLYITAGSNTIYHNNFVNNGMGAYSGGANTWDNGSQGNYWSDYPPKYDTDHDGIGEIPYNITAVGNDNHPLINTWSQHDIAVVNVTTSANHVDPGTLVNITVTVRNNANTSVSENFTVTARYNSTNIETKTVTNLAQGATQILTFSWNTTGLAGGNYTISAAASTVPDELNTDNTYIDGTVMISSQGDANGDGQVDVFDILIIKAHWGETPTSPDWDPNVDVNGDNIINVYDILIVKANWGRSY